MLITKIGKEIPKNWDILQAIRVKSSKIPIFAQFFQNIWDILHSFHNILQISQGKNPKILGLPKSLLQIFYAQYLFNSFMWFYVDF